MHRISFLSLILIACSLPVCAGGTGAWPKAHDLQAAAAKATGTGRLLVVYVTMPGCPYCEKLEKDLLTPAWSRGELSHVHFVELSWEEQAVVNFDGKTIQAPDLLKSYGVPITPTMMFLGSDGEQLVKAIYGYQSEDFYWQYFMDAVREASEWLD